MIGHGCHRYPLLHSIKPKGRRFGFGWTKKGHWAYITHSLGTSALKGHFTHGKGADKGLDFGEWRGEEGRYYLNRPNRLLTSDWVFYFLLRLISVLQSNSQYDHLCSLSLNCHRLLDTFLLIENEHYSVNCLGHWVDKVERHNVENHYIGSVNGRRGCNINYHSLTLQGLPTRVILKKSCTMIPHWTKIL